MNTYEFAGLPRPSTVASLVTLMVTAWFALAGGAIIADRESGYAARAARDAAPVAEIAPQARFTIVVEARRPQASL